jgi:hypothetical protein
MKIIGQASYLQLTKYESTKQAPNYKQVDAVFIGYLEPATTQHFSLFEDISARLAEYKVTIECWIEQGYTVCLETIAENIMEDGEIIKTGTISSFPLNSLFK